MDRQGCYVLIMEIPVKEIVNDELAKLGFKKRGLSWYKHYKEVIHVVALQKSVWGNSYHINLAVWVNELGSSEQPKCRECHLQVRLASIDGSSNEIDAALNEEDYWKMDAERRRDIIKLALCNAEFAFFQELKSLEQVKQFVKNRPRINLAVTKSLAELARD
jgi:hypothetical protein